MAVCLNSGVSPGGGSPHPTVPLLCPYDSVFVSILQKTVFNAFKQSEPISTPRYAPNAIVVLDVVGSNPTSRPKINSLRELLDQPDFRTLKSGFRGLESMKNQKLETINTRWLCVIVPLRNLICFKKWALRSQYNRALGESLA
jgi:hypothetical protein